ncbi:hypothetical protein FACS189421_13570 [Bacteroidia bacterium]|nr:hypothetical protein FACS189421_13570 [Bacteroidia bacterium]
MNVKNYAMMIGAAAVLAACGGTSSITESAELANGGADKVYFAFDSSAISQDAKTGLLGQSLYLKSHPDTKVLESKSKPDERTKSIIVSPVK